MSKFSITYERTVRIRPYETLKIGIYEEFDYAVTPQLDAFGQVRDTVDCWVEEERDRLRAEEENAEHGS